MDGMEKDMGEMKSQLNELYLALMGSKITNDGGMVARIIELESEVTVLKREQSAMKADKAKTELYVKIMWGMVGAFASGTFLYILNLIFKK